MATVTGLRQRSKRDQSLIDTCAHLTDLVRESKSLMAAIMSEANQADQESLQQQLLSVVANSRKVASMIRVMPAQTLNCERIRQTALVSVGDLAVEEIPVWVQVHHQRALSEQVKQTP